MKHTKRVEQSSKIYGVWFYATVLFKLDLRIEQGDVDFTPPNQSHCHTTNSTTTSTDGER